ncbi:pyrroline-5-carboxylate reductase (plasmid) [Arthrobacter sp. StoSoilB3]|nr:pyrroline-5-carboxylate reductase [Arthrobacter sp. StoSoilB3]
MNLTETASLPTVTFLGAGAMGGAIIKGLLTSTERVAGEIRATGQWSPQMQELTDTSSVVTYDTDADPEANIKAVTDASIIVLALKPDVVPPVLEQIAETLRPDAIVVSIAAGITIQTVESMLPEYVSVIRVMPNMPALVGKGVSGISPGTRAGGEAMEVVGQLFQTVGSVLAVPETQLDALTSISGSGPAYVYFLIEQLTQVAIEQGFTPDQASVLVHGTFRGASELLAISGKTPAELRTQVTSPKGTTAAALAILTDGRIKEVLSAATNAAVLRARELAVSPYLGLHG